MIDTGADLSPRRGTPAELVEQWKKDAYAYESSDAPDGFAAYDVALAYRRCAKQLEAALAEVPA